MNYIAIEGVIIF